jgi:hypothetical protein
MIEPRDQWLRFAGLCSMALIVILAGVLALWRPALAADGTCSESSNSTCITRHSVWAEKACTSGAGEDCITCSYHPNSVCTWVGGDAFHYKDDSGIG